MDYHDLLWLVSFATVKKSKGSWSLVMNFFNLYHGVRLRQREHIVVISCNQAIKRNVCL